MIRLIAALTALALVPSIALGAPASFCWETERGTREQDYGNGGYSLSEYGVSFQEGGCELSEGFPMDGTPILAYCEGEGEGDFRAITFTPQGDRVLLIKMVFEYGEVEERPMMACRPPRP
ncbi:MAG: hypothetical protein H0W99_16270 [Acidobacteria bacterium]|nr:hypothetical protein [Acidobacteriota bacterium]